MKKEFELKCINAVREIQQELEKNIISQKWSHKETAIFLHRYFDKYYCELMRSKLGKDYPK